MTLKYQQDFKNLNLWKKTLIELNCHDHYQSNSFLNYQNEYLKNTSKEISFIAFKNNKPLFIFPLFYNFKEIYFHNFDEFIKLPNIEINEKIEKIILSLFDKNNASFFGIYKNQQNKFYNVGSCETLNINLRNNLDIIFSNFRKSYKSLIRKKSSEINMSINFKNDCSNEWEEFKKLHLSLAGKATRTIKSWEIQKDNILKGKGLFIYFKKDGKLISGAFFDLTDKDIKYSVSLTDKNYFNYNCNHKILYQAIKFGHEKKISNMYLGTLKNNEKMKD